MAIRKYFKLYRKLISFSAQLETEYRASFLIELVVEFGYFFVGLVSVSVIFSNIKSIAGWDYYSTLVLMGLGMSASEIVTGIAFVFNLRELPSKIVKGDLDLVLIKPVNSQFAVSLWRPYFALIPPTIFGFIIASYGFIKGNFVFFFPNFIFALSIYICGIICAYCFGMMVSTLSMWIVNANPLPFVAQNTYSMAQRPTEIFKGFWKVLFTYILPLAFFANFPALTLMGKGNLLWLVIAPCLATAFILLSNLFWKKALRSYSSASS